MAFENACPLLTAPVQVTIERLATRTTNSYGKHPDERARILADKADVEPMLTAGADLVVDTTESIDLTVQRLLDSHRALASPTPTWATECVLSDRSSG